MKPARIPDTMSIPLLSIRIAKYRTPEAALFMGGVQFASELLLVRPSYWLVGCAGRHTDGTEDMEKGGT